MGVLVDEERGSRIVTPMGGHQDGTRSDGGVWVFTCRPLSPNFMMQNQDWGSPSKDAGRCSGADLKMK